MEENQNLNPQEPQGGAPEANTNPVTPSTPQPQPSEKKKDPRVEECQDALAAFPTLEEGYITKKGIYFDKEVAEDTLQDGEKLTIVKRPKKK